MRSTSQNPRIPRFEDVLNERVLKQQDWNKKYIDMPLIDEHAKVS
jgi:hypothetical protein